MKNNEVNKLITCFESKVEAIKEAGKRAEFLLVAKMVEIVHVAPDGWEKIDLRGAEQLRSGLRKNSGKWSLKGFIEPYKALPTEYSTKYNKCPEWENAPWGYDLVLPMGVWDKIKIEIGPSALGWEFRRIKMSYNPQDMPEKVMLLEMKLR